MKYLIWDFDGTLGYRQGGMWSKTLIEVLQQEMPELHATIDQIRPFLRSGFPWDDPDRPHTNIKSPAQWWDALDEFFENAFLGIGIHPNEVGHLAKQVRYFYPTLKSWRLFEDVNPALEQLSAADWTHLVLSNHVPELRQIMHFLGLDQHISRTFNSAETGYEKPHPQAFLTLTAELDDAERIWMIGDNMDADILGAEKAGLPGILVRRFHADAKYYCPTLAQVLEMVEV